MAKRTSVEDIQEWLVGLGASPEEAVAITDNLAAAQLSPARMRRWLKPDQSYRIVDAWLDDVPWCLAGEFLVQDGKADKVIAAAEEFAAASGDERFISTTLAGANLDLAVRKLTRGDPSHAARVRRVLELLLAQLRTPTRVDECLHTTFGVEDTRLVDHLLDDRFEAVLASLEGGSFDAWHHMKTGRLDYSGF